MWYTHNSKLHPQTAVVIEIDKYFILYIILYILLTVNTIKQNNFYDKSDASFSSQKEKKKCLKWQYMPLLLAVH